MFVYTILFRSLGLVGFLLDFIYLFILEEGSPRLLLFDTNTVNFTIKNVCILF